MLYLKTGYKYFNFILPPKTIWLKMYMACQLCNKQQNLFYERKDMFYERKTYANISEEVNFLSCFTALTKNVCSQYIVSIWPMVMNDNE